MSFEVDVVYEALLTVSAAHRAALLSCQNSNTQEAAKWKVMGLSAYGRTVRSIAGKGCNMYEAPMTALKEKLIAQMLLAYFEVPSPCEVMSTIKWLKFLLQCFMDNPKGVFRHLWASIQVLRIFEERASPAELEAITPVQEVILRLDHLAQKMVPFAQSSFLRGSDRALMQSPFWNRPALEFSGATPLDPIHTEGNNLIRLVGGHNKIGRVVWGLWYPTSERPSRDELMSFYSEMLLWKSASPATFATCPDLDDLQPSNIADFHALPIPPLPLHFTSNEAALNVVMFNGYMGCALAMISSTDEDPAAQEMEIFRLVYQNLRICAGLLNLGQGQTLSSYKPCETLGIGISTFLYHGARRCFSMEWQKWTTSALRAVHREGLSNGPALANTLDIMSQVQSTWQCNFLAEGSGQKISPLGSMKDRLVPMLIPQDDDGLLTAFYLRYGTAGEEVDESVVRVIAKATWKQEKSGAMDNLRLYTFSPNAANTPRSPHLLASWRTLVEPGWHGFLSAANIQTA